MNENQKSATEKSGNTLLKIRGDFHGVLIIGICLLLPIALICCLPKVPPVIEHVAPFCIFIGFVGAMMILYSVPIGCKSLMLSNDKVTYATLFGKSEIALHELNYVLQGTTIGRGRGGYKLLFSKTREPGNRYEIAFRLSEGESDGEEAAITVLGYAGGEFVRSQLIIFLKMLKQISPRIKIDEDVILRLEGKVDQEKLAKAFGGGNPSIRPPL